MRAAFLVTARGAVSALAAEPVASRTK